MRRHRLTDKLFAGRASFDHSQPAQVPPRRAVSGPPPAGWGDMVPCIVKAPDQSTQREIERANGQGSIFVLRFQDDLPYRADLERLGEGDRVRLYLTPDDDPTRDVVLTVVGPPIFEPNFRLWIVTLKAPG